MTRTASAKRKRAEREAIKAEHLQKRPKVDNLDNYLEKKLFVEKSTGADRVREAKLYEHLASEDVETRVVAAEAVLSSLFDGEGVPESVLAKHLDWRLFRGLASSRAGARVGYSLVITEVLRKLYGPEDLRASRYPDLTFKKVLDILQQRTRPTGHMTGQEERDFFFGQLFGLECFSRAGIFAAAFPQNKDGWHETLGLLFKLALDKVWLRSHCFWVITEALPNIGEELACETAGDLIKEWAKTPEGVAVQVAARDAYPDIGRLDRFADPLDPASFAGLPALLRESSGPEDAAEEKTQGRNKKTNKHSNWSHQLHFVWGVILKHYLGQGEVSLKGFKAFWTRCVDDNLFTKTASDGQKLRGFLVFQAALKVIATEPQCQDDREQLLSVIFSKNLLTCLMNQAANEDRYLHRAARKTLSIVEQTAVNNPDMASDILENLITGNGVYSFDVRTAAKTVENILQRLKPEAAEELTDVLSAPVMKTCTKGKDLDKVKLELRVYVEYLFKLANAAPESALKELTALAYAQPVWVPSNVAEFVKELSRNRLQSVFANLSKKAEDSTYLCTAIEGIDPKYIKMDTKLKKAVGDARKKLNKLMQVASKDTESSEARAARGLSLLYAIAIFQLYNAEPDAFQLLGDLEEYHTRHEEDAEGAAEFLVETLLSLVSQESVLLRQISQQVFGCFADRVSPKALELLLDVLAADENAKGQQALFNIESEDIDPEDIEEEDDDEEGEDEDIEDDDDFDSDMEIDSDVEFVTLNGADGEDDENAEGSDDDEEEEEETGSGSESEGEEDSEEAKNLEAIDDALGKILNSHRLDQDKEAESSDSDADMTDSEMIALDDKLSAVFKDRIKNNPSGKKERKAAKESVVNFKRRVLSLLETYIRTEAGNPTTMATLLPLLQLIRTTSIKSLADRSLDMIKEYQKRLRKARAVNKDKENPGSGPDPATTLQLLKDIQGEAAASEMNDHAKAAAAATLIVASSLFMADEASREAVEAEMAKLERKTEKTGKKKGRKGNKKNKAAELDVYQDWKQWRQNFQSKKEA